MMSLELNEKEMEFVKTAEQLKNILVSRALYNESYNYEFSEEEKKVMHYQLRIETLNYYMNETITPRIMVNENTIIDEYNKHKEYFDNNNIPFSKAHDMVKENLTMQANIGLEQDLVAKLVHNMPEQVTLKKEDIISTQGNAETIKTILLLELFDLQLAKEDFVKTHEEALTEIKNIIQVNVYLRSYCSKDLVLTQKELKEIIENNEELKERYKDSEPDEEFINQILENKLQIKIAEHMEEINKKYNIDEELKKYNDRV